MSKRKIRVNLKKNRSKPPRDNSLTRDFNGADFNEDTTTAGERVRTKGELSRRRTIIQEQSQVADMPSVSADECRHGRVLRTHGLVSIVESDGREFRCGVRRVLKTLATDERSIVTTGDLVWFLPSGTDEGVIERVEPRHGVLTRSSRRREHVLVANVDQVVIVVSLVEPELKPHLIDRFTASAQRGGLKPVLCLNKVDRVDPVDLQPLVGSYAQLGIKTILTSASNGAGVDILRDTLIGRASVFSGQSGVGKSSLLNAIQPGLGLIVREVSDVNQKGKHTTTNAQLLKLDCGGWVVDTPGIRQLELWDLTAGEVEGLFPEFRPYVTQCTFPDCTHTHELNCAVKRAVTRRQVSGRRYTSYLGLLQDAQGAEE